MARKVTEQERKFADEIFRLRSISDLDGAVAECDRVKADHAATEKRGKCEEIVYLCHIIEKECTSSQDSVNVYLLKHLERNRLYEQALGWVKRMLDYSRDWVVAATLFRLCRESDDYGEAQTIIWELLDGVLRQTERVGKLLSRFSLIFSSKSEKTYFNVYQAVRTVFDELSSRLANEEIAFTLEGTESARIYGEELQFSQICDRNSIGGAGACIRYCLWKMKGRRQIL